MGFWSWTCALTLGGVVEVLRYLPKLEMAFFPPHFFLALQGHSGNLERDPCHAQKLKVMLTNQYNLAIKL